MSIRGSIAIDEFCQLFSYSQNFLDRFVRYIDIVACVRISIFRGTLPVKIMGCIMIEELIKLLFCVFTCCWEFRILRDAKEIDRWSTYHPSSD